MKSVLVFVVLAGVGGLAAAQAYPVKPIRLIDSFGAGGTDDFLIRLLGTKMSEIYKSQVIVENRPGAGGAISQVYVAKSPPDGYTLLLGGGGMTASPLVNAAATFDIDRDFTPISLLDTNNSVLVTHRSVPAKNVAEFIKLARAQPEKLTFATIGQLGNPFWFAIIFNHAARVKGVEIAYKGMPAPMVDLAAGRVDYGFYGVLTVLTYREKLRLLGVTGAQRVAQLPDIPRISESGLPGYELEGFRSVLGPAGVPRDIVSSLNSTIVRILATPDVKEQFLRAGADAKSSTPEELVKRQTERKALFTKFAKLLELKPQ